MKQRSINARVSNSIIVSARMTIVVSAEYRDLPRIFSASKDIEYIDTASTAVANRSTIDMSSGLSDGNSQMSRVLDKKYSLSKDARMSAAQSHNNDDDDTLLGNAKDADDRVMLQSRRDTPTLSGLSFELGHDRARIKETVDSKRW